VTAVAAVLMALGVAVQVLGVAGVAAMRRPLARLHYAALSSPAALLIAAALVAEEGVTQLSGRSMMLTALVVLSGPAVSHVVARAVRLRERRA
jgi:multisubunit Na+/H+ antiporter MnhG subunit